VRQEIGVREGFKLDVATLNRITMRTHRNFRFGNTHFLGDGSVSRLANGEAEMRSKKKTRTNTNSLTDLENARRFAEQHGDDLRHVARRRE